MAAILRVKRRHDDEPLNALVISCKRQKTVENEETETETSTCSLTTVAKFAGTVHKQEDNVEHLIQTYKKNELQANFKSHPIDIINKIRKTTLQASAENRYKVVNCFRSLNNSNVENSEEKVMTVIDVEDSKSIADKDSVEKDDHYVYDLYYAQTNNDMYLDDMVFVHPYEQELVYDTYRDNGYPEPENESEDSNSESNWRNDYPDSSHSECSINEDDIKKVFMNMKLEEGSDLSEEDDFVYAVDKEDDFVYAIDEEDEDDFVYAVDKEDEEAYGLRYARYKARVKKELEEDEEEDSDECYA